MVIYRNLNSGRSASKLNVLHDGFKSRDRTSSTILRNIDQAELFWTKQNLTACR